MPINIPKAPKKKSSNVAPRPKKIAASLAEGMKDMLPKDVMRRRMLEDVLTQAANCFSFKPIEPAIVEELRTYENTYSFEEKKQLYTLRDPVKVVSVLRPWLVPGVVRAYYHHKLSRQYNPGKFLYYGWVWGKHVEDKEGAWQTPQGGLLMINSPDPVYDAQTIATAYYIAQALKAKNPTLTINSMGCATCKKTYTKKLKNHYRGSSSVLCRDCKVGYRKNDISMMSCVNEQCQPLKDTAPIILDALCTPCREHFKGVLDYLDALPIPYMVDPFLIYPEQYWTKTVFKIKEQDADIHLMHGGRHDGLAYTMKVPKTPSMETIFNAPRIEALAQDMLSAKEARKRDDVYLIYMGRDAKKRALALMRELYEERISVRELFSKASLQNQLAYVKKEKGNLVLILGQKEVFENVVIVRDIESGAQETVPLSRIAKELKKRLS